MPLLLKVREGFFSPRLERRYVFYLLRFFFEDPKSAFQSMLCAFRFRPAFVVGIPVALAIFRFALVIPNARFQLNPPNDINYLLWIAMSAWLITVRYGFIPCPIKRAFVFFLDS